MRLEGKVALIAGGASGIGAATGRRFAREGARVMLGDTDEAGGEGVASEIRAAGGQAAFVPLDVGREDQAQRAVAQSREAFGALDILVNCAIKMYPGTLIDLSRESWEKLLEVGLTGTFLMCQAAGRAMIEAGRGGNIVNLSSNAGLAPYPGAGAYSTCKAGIVMLSRQLSLEWAPHKIRVNCICPAHVLTPLTAYLQDPEIRKGREAVTPLGRVGMPEDVANAALYLASDEADWVSGTVLVIDGAITHSIFSHMPGRKWRD